MRSAFKRLFVVEGWPGDRVEISRGVPAEAMLAGAKAMIRTVGTVSAVRFV